MCEQSDGGAAAIQVGTLEIVDIDGNGNDYDLPSWKWSFLTVRSDGADDANVYAQIAKFSAELGLG